MANGTRQILLTLIPSAALMAALSVPITRLVFQRGAFHASDTHLVAVAMFWWSLSLPAQGASLLFSRTFFSLQQPWLTTALSCANLAVNAALSVALYKPLGIAGVVLGSVAGTLVMAFDPGAAPAPPAQRHRGTQDALVSVRMLAASAVLAGWSYFVWDGFDRLLGRSLIAQIVSLGVAIGSGLTVYGLVVLAMRIEEAGQIRRYLESRLHR